MAEILDPRTRKTICENHVVASLANFVEVSGHALVMRYNGGNLAIGGSPHYICLAYPMEVCLALVHVHIFNIVYYAWRFVACLRLAVTVFA